MKIKLQPYDPEWPRLYDRLSDQLESVLEVPGIILEHIGSTAVAGMPAKAVIDILAGVPDDQRLDDLPDRVLDLKEWFYVPY